MDNQQTRQAIADSINAKLSNAITVEEIAYLIDSYIELNKTGLILIYDSQNLSDKLANAILNKIQDPTASGRDLRLAAKYSENLLSAQAQRQAIADRINTKISSASSIEDLSYIASAYKTLDKSNLNLLYDDGNGGTIELRFKINDAIMSLLGQSNIATSRDVRLAAKYTDDLVNLIPSDPTNTGDFPSSLVANRTFNFTFTGATDPDGTITHYLVDQISSQNLTVTTNEVAVGSPHEFTVSNISSDETVTFRVRAKDDNGYYSPGITVTVNLTRTTIGVPGEAGFGVGIAPQSLVNAFNLTPMIGYDTPTHENYGNYTDASGSVMVFIPKHYVKLSYETAIPYEGLRVDVSDIPQPGYSLPRCFINNGVEVAGIFVDKYLMGREGTIGVSKRNLDPVSTNSGHNPISNLTANGQTPTNRYDGMYSAVKTRGNDYSLTTIFTYTMLANLADAHYQACYRKNDFSTCAWADVAPYQPKGCNNNALKDANDSSVVYTSSGHNNCGLTGGVDDTVFAKITHNGQKCGVTDLNGNMFEVAAGYITDASGNHLVLKESVDVKNLTATSAYDTANYDQITIPLTLDNTQVAFGNGINQFFSGSTDRNSNAYKLDNIGLPMADTAVSSAGTNRFGGDGFWRYQRNEMCPLVSGTWATGVLSGARTRSLYFVRSHSYGHVGGRACLIP